MNQSMFIYLFQYSELECLQAYGLNKNAEFCPHSLQERCTARKWSASINQNFGCLFVNKKLTTGSIKGASLIQDALHSKTVKRFMTRALSQPAPFREETFSFSHNGRRLHWKEGFFRRVVKKLRFLLTLLFRWWWWPWAFVLGKLNWGAFRTHCSLTSCTKVTVKYEVKESREHRYAPQAQWTRFLVMETTVALGP